ncbi:hypothetical protein EMIHUDRAFT_444157 [Emiliania huxleyi CCMP1516]|uniref:Transmembrane protein 230 n=2 Tax=Emiliania huxleyi TaxID=2903 RepID=A0A0D3JIQ1_EMIH1|nr:hypothetical protein EMIHUDRAFT_444157 [Emiliania huxleyi CCMP1516]EOD23386.1 hypothetical protein EMIHUDRAFT_444157 [Emiliania huxleyi CCMP1516]|eukprot:XP_005775815.1 hypothetical protein EMIHUDRAFT_444157 [Emiliania huxleyi CCMP1516]
MPFHLVLLISTGAAALLQPPPALHGGGSRPVALEVKRPERHVPERHVPASAGMPIAIPLRPIPLRLHAPRAGTVMQLFPPPRPPRVDELLPRGAPFRDVERDIFRYLGGLAAVGGFAAALFFFLSLGALPVILLSVGGVGAILYASSAGEGAFFARRDAEFGYSDEPQWRREEWMRGWQQSSGPDFPPPPPGEVPPPWEGGDEPPFWY